MTTTTNASSQRRNGERIRWLRLIGTFIALILISVGLAFLTHDVIARTHLPIDKYDWLAYLITFGMGILANLSVIVPVPVGVSIMIAAAQYWNPVIVVLFGSLGATIGELSGYYAGYLEKKLAIPEDVPWLKKIEHWVRRYGVWAIFLLSLQPVLPFDIGGFVAGTARMPIRKFLPALFLGKFPKYALMVYFGHELLGRLPFISP